MEQKRILYIQHAEAMGGSIVSLRELIIDALSREYRCTVVCSNQVIAEIYQTIGAQAYVSTISTFNHNTAFYYKPSLLNVLRVVKMLLRTMISFIKLIKILRAVRPNVIHLNSSNLILYTVFFRLLQIPTIYHVREYVVEGSFGMRKSIIRALANKMATYIIYISEFELELLGTRPEKSFVIYNYVHENEFKNGIDTSVIRTKGGKFTLITLGGLFSLKGGKQLVESLKDAGSDVELLVLGSEDPRVDSKEIERIDGLKYANEIIALLEEESVSSKVKIIGKVGDPARYIDQADALVFWAALPHFPRPVFEAWLLRKPVLYFNPFFKNNKINSLNVFIVPEASSQSLCDSIKSIRISNFLAEQSLNDAYLLAKENFTEKNFDKIDSVYKMCFGISK